MFQIFTFLLFFISTLAFPVTVKAQEKINILGVHLTQTSDLDQAASFLNPGGQTWSWVTIVLSKNDLNPQKWQDFFDKCREKHLVPLLRLATQAEGAIWRRPQTQDLHDFASFLEKLNWPSQNQHLILFNEPNRADEWGGAVDPTSYSQIVIEAQKIFKEKNKNFQILLAGPDLAAPQQPPNFYEAQIFYENLVQTNPQILELIDGLASHSYPNHGYIGKPNDSGPHSIQGFQWEINLLESLGLSKKIPIYITETGWPHLEGIQKNYSYYKVSTSAQFLIQALSLWEQNPQIKAATPFIFNYPQEPFDHFSWTNNRGEVYFEYEKIKLLPKPLWKPTQISSQEKLKQSLPLIIFPGQSQTGKITLKNTGQSIWGEENFCFKAQSSQEITLTDLCLPQDTLIKPGEKYEFSFEFTINPDPQAKKLFISWEGIDPIHIKPFLSLSSNLPYRQETGIWDRLSHFFKKLTKK